MLFIINGLTAKRIEGYADRGLFVAQTPQPRLFCRRRSKRLLLNGFANRTAANALRANFHSLHAAAFSCGLNFLEFMTNLSTGLSGDLCTNAAEVSGFIARFD